MARPQPVVVPSMGASESEFKIDLSPLWAALARANAQKQATAEQEQLGAAVKSALPGLFGGIPAQPTPIEQPAPLTEGIARTSMTAPPALNIQQTQGQAQAQVPPPAMQPAFNVPTLPAQERFSNQQIAQLVERNPNILQALVPKEIKEEKLDLPTDIKQFMVGTFGAEFAGASPKKQAEMTNYLQTEEGKKGWNAYLLQYKGQPSFMPVQVGEGISTYNKRTGKWETAPSETKPLPAAAKDEISDLRAAQNTLTELKKAYKPEWVGPAAGRLGGITGTTGIGASKEEQAFRARNAAAKKQMFTIAGKALTETEKAVLEPLWPDVNDSPSRYEAKMAEFEKELGRMTRAKEIGYEEAGFGGVTQKTEQPKSQGGRRFNILSVE